MVFPDLPWSEVFLIFSCFVKIHKLLSYLRMDQDLLLVLG